MDIKIIEERLKGFQPRTKQEEKNILREIAQEIALSGLARTDFFKKAAFIGGSCLRIFHGLSRFSEDLDFWTMEPSPDFAWKSYLQVVEEEFKTYAFHMEIEDRNESGTKMRRAFLKKDSIGKVLILSHARHFHSDEKLQIKFEIDTDPPSGAHYELKNADFPYPFSITGLDRASLFASKLAALFDRKKEGRHWYDFIWYISQKWPISFNLLAQALLQVTIAETKHTGALLHVDWFVQQLVDLVRTINWKTMADDVRKFIPETEQETLGLWGETFFLGHIEALQEYLQPKEISLGALIADGKGKDLLEKVKEAILLGANVNDDSRNGHRPLQLALAKGHCEMAKFLIEQGANVNYRDRSGLTPLQSAVNHGQYEIAKFLVSKGARFNRDAPNLGFVQANLDHFIYLAGSLLMQR